MNDTNWRCEECGTLDDVRLLSIGALTRGNLHAHTFCRDHDPRVTRRMPLHCAACSPKRSRRVPSEPFRG